MVDQSTSANDPIFFIHHSFVDMVIPIMNLGIINGFSIKIWEMWRIARQSRSDRETVYPMDMQLCANPVHFGSARMRPFEV